MACFGKQPNGENKIFIQSNIQDKDIVEKIEKFDKDSSIQSSQQSIEEFITANSNNENECLEWKIMLCLHDRNYEALYEEFGLDKTKVLNEVEKFTGKKLTKKGNEQT